MLFMILCPTGFVGKNRYVIMFLPDVEVFSQENRKLFSFKVIKWINPSSDQPLKTFPCGVITHFETQK